MRLLITGATGFVGVQVCRAARGRGHDVVAAARRPVPGVDTRIVGDVGPDTTWPLDDIDAVIHLAARAHVMKDKEADPLAVFRRINRDGAVRLGEQAAAAGVRMVFVSSVKVNGEAGLFRAEDKLAPVDPYGISKAEAEQRLAAIPGLSLAVVRPPLVHGPGAKGNLAALMKALRRGIPLPLGCIANRRSLVGVANLAEALVFLAERDARGTFLVSDGEPVSTPQLIRLLAAGMGVKPRLLPVPVSWLRLAGALAGKDAAVARLTGSLEVDDAPLRALGWSPKMTLAEGLATMAQGLDSPSPSGA
jgi:nucleoside-diphosphate-sugar epimerase